MTTPKVNSSLFKKKDLIALFGILVILVAGVSNLLAHNFSGAILILVLAASEVCICSLILSLRSRDQAIRKLIEVCEEGIKDNLELMDMISDHLADGHDHQHPFQNRKKRVVN